VPASPSPSGPDSPRRNRVTPMGDIVAIPLRGAWTGNRGNLHEGTEIVRFHRSALWITCALRFRDWWHEQWMPRRFTWLFFHDEAVAFAAGHRPCALCRRLAYLEFQQAWVSGNGGPVPKAWEMNRQLHAERIIRGTHRRKLHQMGWDALPDGAFVLAGSGPALVLGDTVVPWTVTGYTSRQPRPQQGTAEVITPPSTVAALRAGYRPQIDAQASRADKPPTLPACIHRSSLRS
jgi:hypothetical protein